MPHVSVKPGMGLRLKQSLDSKILQEYVRISRTNMDCPRFPATFPRPVPPLDGARPPVTAVLLAPQRTAEILSDRRLVDVCWGGPMNFRGPWNSFWLVVTGTMDFYDFPYIWNNHPNWRTHIFQRDWNHQLEFDWLFWGMVCKSFRCEMWYCLMSWIR